MIKNLIMSMMKPSGGAPRVITVTAGGLAATSNNTSSYANVATTVPAVGDLIVVGIVLSHGSVNADATVTDSAGGTYTEVASAIVSSVTAAYLTLRIYVADQLCATTASRNFTVVGNSGNNTGLNIVTTRVNISGMTFLSAAACRQIATLATQTAGTTPTPVFGALCTGVNPVLGWVGNRSNPANVTEPSGWIEFDDIGYSSPLCGLEHATITSGFNSDTVTWGSTSASAYGVAAIEIDY
jgi:hypothetical protein